MKAARRHPRRLRRPVKGSLRAWSIRAEKIVAEHKAFPLYSLDLDRNGDFQITGKEKREISRRVEWLRKNMGSIRGAFVS